MDLLESVYEPGGRRFESCWAHQPSLSNQAKVARRSLGEGGLSLSATRATVGRPTFIFSFDSPQVAEGWRGYAGSNKPIFVKRDSVGKEQLLEPLALVERRLHPEVRGARQNAFRKRQDALHVEFFELAGVMVIGSVAERREMPSDCRCERSAKWSYLSRAKRVRLKHDHEMHAALVQSTVREQVLKLAAIRGLDALAFLESIRGPRNPGGDSIPRMHVRMSAEAPAESGGWPGTYW
jgi:hypothetical protein